MAVIRAPYQTAAVEQAVAHPADRQQLVMILVRHPERSSQGRELIGRVPLAEMGGDARPMGGRIDEQVQEPVELAKRIGGHPCAKPASPGLTARGWCRP